MKNWGRTGAFLVGVVISSGCAGSAVQGAHVRTTTAASVQHRPDRFAQQVKKSTHDSPLVRACKSGDSKACGQLGDKLSIKYAYAEAHEWYALACNRVSGAAMVPTAQRLLGLSEEMKQATRFQSEDVAENVANQKRVLALRNEAIELRSRIQGCFDAGDSLKLDAERKQTLTYFDTVCEFATLVPTVGEAIPGLEHVAESGCEAGQAVRARLGMQVEHQPVQFAQLLQAPAKVASAPAADEGGMVFSEGEL